MIAQHNIPGMNNLRIGSSLSNKMMKAMRRLASGTRVATAADDAACLSISEKMRFLISEQTQSIQNATHGINVAQTADAALTEVNDMLHRAQTLCVQAQNDTLTTEDRAHLNAELSELYSEMERIFDTSRFNELKLFNADGYNPIGPDSVHREYTEIVTQIPSGNPLQSWGTLDIVQDVKFDMAEEAKPASVTMKLDDEVDLSNAASLDGKTFVLTSNSPYSPIRITFSSDPNASTGYTGSTSTADGKYYYEYTVSTNGCTTVQDVLDRLSNMSTSDSIFEGLELDKGATRVDASTREITLTFALGPLEQTINGSTYLTENAGGKDDNSIVLSSTQDVSLKQLDGADSTNNETTYSEVSTTTFDFLPGYSGALTADQLDAIAANTVYLTTNHVISFTTTGESGKIDITGMTAEQIRDAVVAKINTFTNSDGAQMYSAEYDTDGNILLKRLDCSETTVSATYLYENMNYVTQTVPPVSVSAVSTPATGEKGEQCVITLPTGLTSDDLPLNITIGSQVYTFFKYDSSQSVGSTSGSAAWSVHDDNIYGTIASAIHSHYYPDVTISVSGNEITVTGKYAARELNISVTSGPAGTIDVAQRLLLAQEHYLQQTATIPLDLSQIMSSESAVSDLNGAGFSIVQNGSTYRFEFISNGVSRQDPTAYPIDVTGCTSYDSIAQAIENSISWIGGFTAAHDGSGKFTLSVATTFDSYDFIDGTKGTDGLFNNQAGTVSQQASGGSDASQPQTSIDFSMYNSRNFDELYGKGFRITCATCEGEFINIIFCHDAALSGFPSGKVTDVDANGNPITYVNYAVELKDMTDGSDIVSNIVNQLKGKLDHFTDVAVGNPSTVLQIMDKRAGNIVKDGSILRAEILSGVYTNCTYSMTYVEHVNTDAYIGAPGSNTTAYYGYCPIYVGSNDQDGQFILVHLPNLSLSMLNLDPPAPDLTNTTALPNLMERLKTAESVILTARGQLGADQNRLEHAHENLGVSVEQTTASYSTIKDADMAAEIAEQTKISILQNFQQATLSHIMDNASSIISLLK